MAITLTCYGGGGKVTGSNFLVTFEGSSVLVDCGIEQGSDFCEECAYAAFPYDPKGINALIVTHAHLDHVGRIPKLVRDGFRGKIYMTPPTRDLAELVLRDSLGILAREAELQQHAPLYEEKDVGQSFSQIETLSYHEEKEVAPGLSVYLRNTGHILGSASVRIKASDGSTLALTGDLGNSPSPLLPDWEAIPDADAVLMESVYGSRMHPPPAVRLARLKETLLGAIRRGGAILIPAFSIERTQLMLYELSNLFASGELPKVPVFLDSPLAIEVTKVYEKWGPTYFKPDIQKEMESEGSLFSFPFLTQTKAPTESGKIMETGDPKIIIAGSGMSHGGRIGRHELKYLPDAKATVIIVGYQAPGSPGRRMQDGAPYVKINGREVHIRAKIESLEGWSGHADRDGLFAFAEAAVTAKRTKTILTALGEPANERFLAQRIHDYLGIPAYAVDEGQKWEITKDSVRQIP